MLRHSSILVLAVTSGCALELDSSSNLETYSRTVVRFGPNGPSVTTTPITADEQQAEIAAREEALAHPNAPTPFINVDTCTDGYAIWMYDQSNLQGNEICFLNAGTAVLSNYSRVVCNPMRCYYNTWDSAVRSFWAGHQAGYFIENGGLYDWFNQDQQENTVSSTTANASWLELYDP